MALPASADRTKRIIRWMALSSPTLVAVMVKAPNWLTVPLATSSPTPLSTGRDSPVITAWLMEVWPLVMTPSTGMVSPGSTRSCWPTRTSSAGTISSPLSPTTRAVRGVRWTSRSMPARALATVRSSNKAPSCMIKATSPAAKSSPVHNALFFRYGMRPRLRRSYSPIPAIARIAIPAKIIPATGGTKLRLPGASLRSLTASFSRGCKGTSREYTT